MAGHEYYTLAHSLVARIAAGESCNALALELGWRPDSVRSAASKARRGILKPPGSIRSDGWSEEMDRELIKYWDRENAPLLAKRIGRLAGRPITEHSVSSRAHRLGLEKAGTPTSWQTRNLGSRAA